VEVVAEETFRGRRDEMRGQVEMWEGEERRERVRMYLEDMRGDRGIEEEGREERVRVYLERLREGRER
jgi:hypothetical protein